MTPQQARVVEVTEALKPAYERASTLELTDAEVSALMEPFPDSVVDIRPHDGLIYISHIHISNRLNKVFKPGKWALVRRWEKFEGGVMYAEYVLLIRGCFIGEAIGGHPYVPTNPKTNYSDALEATAGEALRRIAGKRLSCGSQVWEGDYAKEWVAKYAYQQNGKSYKRRGEAPKQATVVAPKPAPAPLPANPTKADLLASIRAHLPKGMEEWLVGFLRVETDKNNVTWLMPNETLEDLSEEKLTILAKSPTKMLGRLQTWVDAQKGEAPAPESDDWREFIVPFGKHKGTRLEDLEKNTLFGFWANYEVEKEYQGKPKKPETIEADQAFRDALDEAGIHYEFKMPD